MSECLNCRKKTLNIETSVTKSNRQGNKKVKSLRLFVTLWTVARQAPLSMEFPRQESWSGLPCLPPGDLPNPGIEPMFPASPALAGGFFTTVIPVIVKLFCFYDSFGSLSKFILACLIIHMGFPGGTSGKEPTCQCGDMRGRFNPWVGKIPWRKAWQPTQVFLPRKSRGQRILVGYSPYGHKELDMTEAT